MIVNIASLFAFEFTGLERLSGGTAKPCPLLVRLNELPDNEFRAMHVDGKDEAAVHKLVAVLREVAVVDGNLVFEDGITSKVIRDALFDFDFEKLGWELQHLHRLVPLFRWGVSSGGNA